MMVAVVEEGWRVARSDERSMAEVFARLALEFHDAGGVQDTIQTVVEDACQAVGCKYAAAALVCGREVDVLALTDAKLADLYEGQIDAGEGPVITVLDDGQAVLVPDVTAETRWSPAWAQDAEAAGIRCAMHLPLVVAGNRSAVLSLYGEEPGGFCDDDLAVAHILARHAMVAIATARREEDLNRAVDARKLVGQAMGILMERYDLDGDRAFEVLRRYSQANNRKLHDVAQELIATRELPR